MKKNILSGFYFILLGNFLFCSDLKRPPIWTLFLVSNIPTNIGIVTTDFGGGGRFKVLSPELKSSYPGLTPIHSDAVARFQNGKVYVVNRLGKDSIQVLDPNLSYQTISEWSVGEATNPQDISLSVGQSKAFVSLYGSRFLRIFHSETGSVIGNIDLGSYSEQSPNPDGLPEMAGMISVGNSLYVCLQRLDRNDPSGYYPPYGSSLLVEIDMTSNQVVGTFEFPVPNPLGKPQFVKIFGEDHLVFATANRLGFLSAMDGGVTAFRLSSKTFLSRVLYDEKTAGGDILAVQVADDNIGYASVLDASFNKTLQVFNPSTGQKLNTLLSIPTSTDASLSSLLIARDGILYVGNKEFERPGVSMYDTKNNSNLLSPTPISVDLQPFDFIELSE
ncbi:YncE family protein [Leptospira ilyithenensis]|uniref:Uncharacterized protein n=1 Tax=Leptospira ilyithenensis TaxID=2484901 RepID=A0A4R9LM81_9LEPT|nr:hypothetical protein [Leptospira ilyithenensis]TGN07110.1 hypothetical protein EHS11_18515 [Leptospira ilyithenensis]